MRVFLENRLYRFVRQSGHVIGHASGQQFVEHHADGVDIASRVDRRRIAEDLLRAHVGERAHQLSFTRVQRVRRLSLEQAGDAEVEHFRLARAIDEDVARLDVAVDDAAIVRVLDGVADSRDELEPRRDIERVRRDVLAQWRALDELHGEVRLRCLADLRGPGLVDLRDAGMLQPAEHLRLALETLEHLPRGQAASDDFQRDPAPR